MGGQGEEVWALQGGAGQAAVQGVNQLNQAQCSQGAQTDCYLNHQTRGTVGRLHPATGGGGKLNLPTGRLYWRAESGPGGVAGTAALPRPGWVLPGPSLPGPWALGPPWARVGRLKELVSWWRPVQP